MSNNRESRYLDLEVRKELTATVGSLHALISEMADYDWEISDDDIDWLEHDLSNLKAIQQKMEYTYYVE